MEIKVLKLVEKIAGRRQNDHIEIKQYKRNIIIKYCLVNIVATIFADNWTQTSSRTHLGLERIKFRFTNKTSSSKTDVPLALAIGKNLAKKIWDRYSRRIEAILVWKFGT